MVPLVLCRLFMENSHGYRASLYEATVSALLAGGLGTKNNSLHRRLQEVPYGWVLGRLTC